MQKKSKERNIRSINYSQTFQPMKTYPKVNLPKLQGKQQAERNSF